MPKSSMSFIGSVCFICVEFGRRHRTVAGSGHVLRDDGHCVGVLLASRSLFSITRKKKCKSL
jgi:hypothetical protein